LVPGQAGAAGEALRGKTEVLARPGRQVQNRETGLYPQKAFHERRIG
jgi:hypothetical protein